MSDGVARADLIEGYPHPRESQTLVGHSDAERTLAQAFLSGRMHHAWILGGPKGVGKATLAYRFARAALAGTVRADSLATPADHPVARQVAQGAHPDLLTLARVAEAGKERPPQDIPVDLVRKTTPFFGSTAGAGGWRICIIDAADELNRSGANAILKHVEEPPARSLFLIVAHVPGRLLPTIRSRCRTITLKPLDAGDLGLALDAVPGAPADAAARREAIAIAEGSVGRALLALDDETLDLRALVGKALAGLPRAEAAAVHVIGDRLARRDDAAFEAFLDAVERHLIAEAARRRGEGPARLAPIAEVWDKVAVGAAQARAYNLDRKPFVFQVFGWLAEAWSEA